MLMAAIAILGDLDCLVESSLVLSGQLGLVVEMPSGNHLLFLYSCSLWVHPNMLSAPTQVV